MTALIALATLWIIFATVHTVADLVRTVRS